MKLYRTVVLDPPWLERGGGKVKRGADRHYSLLKTVDIPRVVYESGVFNFHDDAHMYMWVTNNFLQDGLQTIRALGFAYKTNIVWVKERVGIGQYFRGQHELLLFATKGRGKSSEVFQDCRSLSTVMSLPQARKHSRKPPDALELVEQRSKGPYIEMFADPSQEPRPGWDLWGKPHGSRADESGTLYRSSDES